MGVSWRKPKNTKNPERDLSSPFGFDSSRRAMAIDLFMSSYVINRSLALVHDTLPEFIKSVLTPPLRKLPRRGQSTQVTEA